MPRGQQHRPRRPYKPTAPPSVAWLFATIGSGFFLGACSVIAFVLWRLK